MAWTGRRETDGENEKQENLGDSSRDLFSATLGNAAQTTARPPEKPATAPTEDETLPDPERYEAFKSVDRDPFCLSVYTGDGPADVHAAYQYYQYIATDKHGKIFDIVFAFFTVRGRGRNLQRIIHAVKSKKCVFIQQYQRRPDWATPETGDPVIERIEIIFQPAARTAMLETGGTPAVKRVTEPA